MMLEFITILQVHLRNYSRNCMSLTARQILLHASLGLNVGDFLWEMLEALLESFVVKLDNNYRILILEINSTMRINR